MRAEASENMVTHSDYLSLLNPQQREAVESTEGPVLVLAGAGTGKTRVLTSRIAYILQTGLARTYEILAVTFTNKAAQEMRHRVEGFLTHSIDGMWLGTFHAISVRILRRHAELIGLESSFTILDSDDQIRLIKQILEAEGVDDKKTTAKMVASVISRWKDRALTPEKVSYAESRGQDMLIDIYRTYQSRLKTLNACDFGDLLMHCLTLFQNHPDVLKTYQQQFRYILVDEYQDTNIAQYLWLQLLAQGHKNICCVGDDDQSIYGWRGAEVGNILRFDKDFPQAKTIRLEQNYRSTSHILAAAGHLISHNHDRLGKTLWTDQNDGERVIVRATWDSDDEARFVADKIEEGYHQGKALSDFAILVRAGSQTRAFEERLLTVGIPYKVIGGLRFYERMEIRDALAYFRLVTQPHDGLAFERIINTPRRGIGNATLQLIHKYARDRDISLPQAAFSLIETDEIRGGVKTKLTQFFKNISNWRQALRDRDHVTVAKMILEESGYIQMWKEDKSAEAPGRIENLKELINALGEFESLPGFLDHVSLVMENNQSQTEDLVSLMSLHAAKGLEFKTVFLCGWEETLFPHARSLEENGPAGLEEERRLAYVGLTRAREHAIITYAQHRRFYQGWQITYPSRFLKELPEENVVFIQANGIPKIHPQRTRPQISHHTFEPGDRVFHQKFGYGTVLRVEGDRLEIEFEHSGIKKVVESFVEYA